MNSSPTFWLDGYENAPLRKVLAHFRPWIEDRSVLVVGGDSLVADYVRSLAAEVCTQGQVDFVFAPGVSPETLAAAYEDASANGAAFAGWTHEGAEGPSCSSLHQSLDWPFSIDSSGGKSCRTIFFSNGKLKPIRHPSIGIAIPTHSHPRAALEAMASLAAEYPGETRFALVANGVGEDIIAELKKAVSFDRGQVDLIAFPENRGYGRGCNAGLRALLDQSDLDYIAVSNDDVLPGTDFLYELVRGMQELDSLGHRPGAIGPSSNEISGMQQVEIGAFSDTAEMRVKAETHWKTHRSTANQALQLRGLFLLFSRDCLEAVGGFDPRFGLGNFEDDDHNLRTRLAGFTLWIATGAFLFHYGSSTFKSIQLDYESNIRRNAESMMRKWNLDKLESWVMLDEAPKGLSLFQPFETELGDSHVVKINGEAVDLIHQASDVEFAAWVIGQRCAQTPEGRKKLVNWLTKASKAA